MRRNAVPKKRPAWRHNPLWKTHSLACYDSEWAEWQRAAEMQGKSVNGWIREWLQEAVKYERLSDRVDTPSG